MSIWISAAIVTRDLMVQQAGDPVKVTRVDIQSINNYFMEILFITSYMKTGT